MTQNQKLLSFLKSGKNISAKQARGLFGIKNLRARVQELRFDGFAVYTNKHSTRETSYRLGKPTQRMVQAAYHLMGDRAFQ
jgi:hypothetical protein